MTAEAFEARRQRRLSRLESLADRYSEEALATCRRARAMGEHIPLGQPILVGHHSEKRDRAYRNRMAATYRKGMDLMEKAERYASRLSAARANTSISSDDPNAVSALKEKLAGLEAKQVRFVAINKCVRKKDRAGLIALGLSEKQADEMFESDFAGRLGIPSYEITNNNANIKRIRDRITVLESAASREVVDVEYAWGRYVEDPDDNRVRLHFDHRQPQEVVAVLKSRGFKWSPTNSAWQRQLNNSAVYAAKDIIRQFFSC